MDDNYKELIRLTPKYAAQLVRTIEILFEIQAHMDDSQKNELVLKYQKEKAETDKLSKRFHELIGLTGSAT
jgi:hypothetical protein